MPYVDLARLSPRHGGKTVHEFCAQCRATRPILKPHYYRAAEPVPYGSVCCVCGWLHTKTQTPRGLRKRVIAADGGACVYCGGTENLAADHLLPERLGGQTTFDNLVTACKTCNSRRGTGPHAELRYGRYGVQNGK